MHVRLGEFQNLDELGRGFVAKWHADGHQALQGAETSPGIKLMNTLISPQSDSDLFWKWHMQIEAVHLAWNTQTCPDTASVISTSPPENSTIVGPLTEVIIEFNNKVSAGVRDLSGADPLKYNSVAGGINRIQLKADALKVNGSSATSLWEAGGTTSTYRRFKFTGFTNPSQNAITVTLTGTASYGTKTFQLFR